MAISERAAAMAESVAWSHARLVADPTIQFAVSQKSTAQPPSWLGPLIKVLVAAWPVLRVFFLIALAVVAIIAIAFAGRSAVRWLRRLAPNRRRAGPAASPAEGLRPAASRARALLHEADRLAAEQRFDEAAHMLLFRTIEDLDGRRPHAVRPALTSRDIARLEAMPHRARGAFAIIAEVVEKSFFGGMALDAEGFAACRRAYASFADPKSWAVGAGA
ncbi:MAG TPA: hypothetical protein VII63_00820 [Caulobacteraceae bacterium]